MGSHVFLGVVFFEEIMAFRFCSTPTLLHAIENLPVCCPWHQDGGCQLLPTCSQLRTISDSFFDYNIFVISQLDLLALEHEQRLQNLCAWESAETGNHV